VNRLRTLLFACTALTTLALSIGASADTKLDISNWKEILPEAVYTKLVDESIKNLNTYTASASQFNQNGRRVQAEATNLLVYAEIAQRAGQANAVGLRKAAEELLAAAKAKKGDEAKKLAASLAGYKKMTGTGSGDSDLAKTTSLKTIMDVSVKEIDRNLTQYKRLTPAAFAAKAHVDDLGRMRIGRHARHGKARGPGHAIHDVGEVAAATTEDTDRQDIGVPVDSGHARAVVGIGGDDAGVDHPVGEGVAGNLDTDVTRVCRLDQTAVID